MTQTQYDQTSCWQWRIINAHKIKRWKRVSHQHLYYTIKQWSSPQRDLLQVGLCWSWQKVPSRTETFFDGLMKVERCAALSSAALSRTSQATTAETERARDECSVRRPTCCTLYGRVVLVVWVHFDPASLCRLWFLCIFCPFSLHRV